MNIKSVEVNVESHKEVFKKIKNYLAGRFVGGTRERTLLEEVVKCVFCKYYLIKNSDDNFSVDEFEILKKYKDVFSTIKEQLSFIFEQNEEIQLDQISLNYVNNELNNIDLFNTNRDLFGDLYEVFISTGVREEEGQFFTPLNGVRLLVSLVNPSPKENIIDPAAGAGGFLSMCYQYLHKSLENYNITEHLYGIEKDSYLAKLAATRVAMLSFNHNNIICGDSLSWISQNNKNLKIKENGYFDIVLTNPPFGKNIVAVNKDVQANYDLGYEWKFDLKTNSYRKTEKLQKNVPPQVLFVERCIKLLKDKGRLGIVVPESLITSKSYSYVVNYMFNNGYIKAIIGMPEDFFKTSGKGGTHTKACLVLFEKNKKPNIDYDIFMAEAKWCGHDSRGRIIENDDLPLILQNYNHFMMKNDFVYSHLGYVIKKSNIENLTLSPRYYNPEIKKALSSIKNTHDVLKFGDLVSSGVIELKTGHEVGKLAYGTGDIPFVRTSDISSWEIKIDPKHGVSEEIFEQYSKRQDIKDGDILMVKDGTYLIGTCAMVSKYDTKIVYQSHLYKIRIIKKDVLSPFLLLAVLSSDPVQKQIKSKRFSQDIIDSLGSRINDLILPIPKDINIRKSIEKNVKKAIEDRVEARELARQACFDVVSIDFEI